MGFAFGTLGDLSMDFAPTVDFISKNWIIGTSLAANAWLLKRVIDLHGEKASLEAKFLTSQDKNLEFKEQITQIQKDNSELQKTISETISATGYLVAINNVAVTPRTSGYIKTINVHEGEAAKTNQILFVLNNDKNTLIFI